MLDKIGTTNTVVTAPMLIASLIVASIYLVGLLILACGVSRAPEGFEDENGFHAGHRSDTDESSL
jgi:hypothetical protein